MNQNLAEILRRRVTLRRGSESSGYDQNVQSTPERHPSGVMRSLVEGFAASVRCHRHHTAVRCGEDTLTYHQLDLRAEAIAAAISAATSDPDRPIAILLERCTDMVAAAIAVLRTGSSYLPLDPTTPSARLELILDDADPTLVLTTGSLVRRLPESTAHILLDATLSASPDTPTAAGTPDRETRAYIIFTSGTTGRPKGVQITHGNVLRLFTATEEHYQVSTEDTWTMFHTFAFDFSVWEMWGPLLSGGRLVIAEHDVATDPRAFWALLERERVTILCQTPTAFNQLITEDTHHARRLPLRYVILGGEALRFPDLRRWVDKYGDEKPHLVNMYGPTETTVYASYRRVLREDLDETRSLIGIPLPDLGFTLIDHDLREVPSGEVGELVVTGPGVSPGYLGRPRLNRERFVQLPDGSGRGYRTGDLLIQTETGEFDFQGRGDDQVKIRGFRVELGEVEVALRALDSLAGAAVVARDLPEIGKVLVAYVVPHRAEPAAVELRRSLAATLPPYMIPSVFVTLDELPRTQNGKLDQRALPDPPITPHERDTEQTSPPAPAAPARAAISTESRLAAMVAGLLSLDAVDPRTGFFELGGHSLLALRLLAHVESEFGVDVPLRVFLRDPTVEALAVAVRDGSGSEQPADRGGITLTKAPNGEPVPVTDAQRRLYYITRLEPDNSAYNLHQTFLVEGDLDVAALEKAFRRIVDRHAPLRTVIRPDTAGLMQVARPKGRFQLMIEELRVAPGAGRTDIVSSLSEEELRRPFDLEREDMLRVRLVRLAPWTHVLLLTVHHVASDGWSIVILARELRELYRRFRDDPTADHDPMAALEVEYADYAHSLDRWAASPAAARHIGYWEARLRRLPVLHKLPLDGPRPVRLECAGETVPHEVPTDAAHGIRRLALSVNCTPFMALHAVFAILLAERSGCDDVVVGTPVANRRTSELEGVIGIFVNTLVMRTRVDRDTSFSDLLDHVREQTLLDLEHQHVPLDLLVTRLNPERSTAYSPLFQIMFAYQNNETLDVELDGLDVHVLSSPEQDTQAELMLDVFDVDGSLSLKWHYNPTLFRRETVQGLAHDFSDLLTRVVEHPGTRIAELAARPGAMTPIEQQLFPLRLHPSGADPVFALPGVLGLGASFAQLSAQLEDRSFFALSTREMERVRRRRDSDVMGLATHCADVIADVVGDGPFHLVGHSFGGCLGMHVAHVLRDRGARVSSLVMLDSGTPESEQRELARSRPEQLVSFLGILAEMFPLLGAHAAGDVHGLLRSMPEGEILAGAEKLIGPDGLTLLGGRLTDVFEAYRRMSALHWPATGALDDLPVLLIEVTGADRGPDEELRPEWQRLLGDRMSFATVDAGHESILHSPHAAGVAALIRGFLLRHDIQIAERENQR